VAKHGYPIAGTFELHDTLTMGKLLGQVSINNSDCVKAVAVAVAVEGTAVKFGTVAWGPGVEWEGTITGKTMAGTYTSSGCGMDRGTWQATSWRRARAESLRPAYRWQLRIARPQRHIALGNFF
jgi:hypothetical protein